MCEEDIETAVCHMKQHPIEVESEPFVEKKNVFYKQPDAPSKIYLTHHRVNEDIISVTEEDSDMIEIKEAVATKH
jgi:hypothetical protein